MTLYELRVAVAPEAVEGIDEAIQEAGLLGWNLVEDVIAHTAAVVGLFASEEEGRAAWAQLAAACPPLAEAPSQLRKVAEEEWRESYRAHFKPWQFGRLHWVPIWHKDSFVLPDGHEVLWLDPGLAFGTGNHETTRLCSGRSPCGNPGNRRGLWLGDFGTLGGEVGLRLGRRFRQRSRGSAGE